jgi:hypothetical protein
MSIETFSVVKLVQQELRRVNDIRTKSKRPVDFVEPRESLIELHCRWQTLISQVRKANFEDEASKAAVELAAMAIKFVTDFGDAKSLGLTDADIRTKTVDPNLAKTPIRFGPEDLEETLEAAEKVIREREREKLKEIKKQKQKLHQEWKKAAVFE